MNVTSVSEIQEGFVEQLRLRATNPADKGLTEMYASVLHETHGVSWQDIGMTVVDARVYDFALQIVKAHFSKESDVVPRESILHCIPIQCFTDGQYDSIVPAIMQMNDFPGARSNLYKHAISLIHCSAHRTGQQQVVDSLRANKLIATDQKCCATGIGKTC